MDSELTNQLKLRYEQFFQELEIDKNGILGKISNSRYENEKLRFSGFPYIGTKYFTAKKKILFIGLDIGEDEQSSENTYHNFDSRREVISGSVDGCTSLGYNNHISGTYISAMFLLRKDYDWDKSWDKVCSFENKTCKSVIDILKNSLPLEVLDYVALTNLHKFVTVNRKNRTGDENRRWYNKNQEIDFLIDEIKILNPDIVYFQGSAAKLDTTIINKINSISSICIAPHPSSWRNNANQPNFNNQIIIRKKVS